MIKTILAVLETPQHAAGFVEAVATMADYHQAHTVFAVLTTAPLLSTKLAPLGTRYTFPGELRSMGRDDEQALRAMLPPGLSYELLSQIDDVAVMPSDIRTAAPPADLILLGSREMWQIEWLRRHVTEALLLSCGTPLLLLPAGRCVRKVDHAVLGWKPGAAGNRALRELAALAAPGARIDVVHVDRNLIDQPSVALEPVAAMLERHGFVVDTHLLERTRTVAEVLSAFALDAGANLLAVGGYGHSRAREILLGGVTRSLIEDCRLPVLMAH